MTTLRQQPLIVVSTSARPLAQAARRAGLAARVVDAFGDVDTVAQAERWRRVGLNSEGGLDPDQVLDAVAELSPGPATVVIGSGLEAHPEAIERLAERHALAGNDPQVWRLAGDPRRWFAMASILGIPYPAVSWERPSDAEHWLLKRAASSGGQYVRSATSALSAQSRVGGEWYFQRRVQGQSYSLLFLADGQDMRSVGVNRLLAAPPQAPSPWAWAGAVRPSGLSAELQIRVEGAARALTVALGLRGLNGLDFIVQGDAWFLLELNPRPTATLDLWDVEPMPPLLGLHLQGCAGHGYCRRKAFDALPALPGARAMAVAYAGTPMRVPFDTSWPRACRDRPCAGAQVGPGDPLCTVHACHATADGAMKRVCALRSELLYTLYRNCGVQALQAVADMPNAPGSIGRAGVRA